MSNESSDGATHHQRLLAAAREDNEEVLLDVFTHEGEFDINYQDGLGNTVLHYAASYGSTTVLEHILSHEDCDVDPINRTDKATPLHLALTSHRLDDHEGEHGSLRRDVVESLVDAGADTTIKDKNGDTALDLVPSGDEEIKALIRRARAQAALAVDDITNEDDDEDDGGSGSETHYGPRMVSKEHQIGGISR
jgi:hypothetical protein